VIPRYVETVTVFGHNDEAGRRGARALADAIIGGGAVEVRIEIGAP